VLEALQTHLIVRNPGCCVTAVYVHDDVFDVVSKTVKQRVFVKFQARAEPGLLEPLVSRYNVIGYTNLKGNDALINVRFSSINYSLDVILFLEEIAESLKMLRATTNLVQAMVKHPPTIGMGNTGSFMDSVEYDVMRDILIEADRIHDARLFVFHTTPVIGLRSYIEKLRSMEAYRMDLISNLWILFDRLCDSGLVELEEMRAGRLAREFRMGPSV
jgi:hypothetical protein